MEAGGANPSGSSLAVLRTSRAPQCHVPHGAFSSCIYRLTPLSILPPLNVGLRCASKLQTREMIRLQHTSPDSTRITELKNSIDTMCLVQPAAAVGGSPTLCADVMQSIVGGYNYSDKTYHGTTYQGPGQCAAVVNGTACNWLCQKEFTTERNSFGCCYYSMKAYFEKQNFTDLIGVYSRSDVLAVFLTWA